MPLPSHNRDVEASNDMGGVAECANDLMWCELPGREASAARQLWPRGLVSSTSVPLSRGQCAVFADLTVVSPRKTVSLMAWSEARVADEETLWSIACPIDIGRCGCNLCHLVH